MDNYICKILISYQRGTQSDRALRSTGDMAGDGANRKTKLRPGTQLSDRAFDYTYDFLDRLANGERGGRRRGGQYSAEAKTRLFRDSNLRISLRSVTQVCFESVRGGVGARETRGRTGI